MRWNSTTESAVLARINGTRRPPRWGLRLALLLAVTFAVVVLMVIPGSGPEPGFADRSCWQNGPSQMGPPSACDR